LSRAVRSKLSPRSSPPLVPFSPAVFSATCTLETPAELLALFSIFLFYVFSVFSSFLVFVFNFRCSPPFCVKKNTPPQVSGRLGFAPYLRLVKLPLRLFSPSFPICPQTKCSPLFSLLFRFADYPHCKKLRLPPPPVHRCPQIFTFKYYLLISRVSKAFSFGSLLAGSPVPPSSKMPVFPSSTTASPPSFLSENTCLL